MPHYKLTYFNIRWLGEGARLLFRYAKVPFEDVRITRDQWLKLKPKAPFGQLPLLEVDGHTIAQSAAIYRFLGREFGLVPKSRYDEAAVDSVYDAHMDFRFEFRPYFRVAIGQEKGDKTKLLNEVALPARDRYFEHISKLLKKSDNQYLIGNSTTWADIVIGDNLEVINGLAPGLLDSHPNVKNFVEHVHNLPNLQDYFKERPPSQF